MNRPARRPVVVTGVGAICGQAASAGALFEQLRAGGSAVRNHAGLAACGIPNPACAHLDEALWRLLDDEPSPVDWRPGPQARLALHAAREALAHSGLEAMPRGRTGVFVGANKYTCEADDLVELARSHDPDTRCLSLDRFMQSDRPHRARHIAKRQDAAALAIARLCGRDAFAMTLGDACAAGGIAIGTACRHIRHGEIDVAIAGATEAMCNYVPMIGFGVLGALCDRRGEAPHTLSRPFDRSRSGFVMGEGSAFVVLESEAHAQRRGAQVLGRVSGFAKQAEAWRMTASPADGSEYARCMRAALADAGLAPEEIDHLNAHGTSTLQNDACEAAAIRAVYGERAAEIPLTANKSALGHSLAASGAIEAVLSVMSLARQQLLPTLNFTEADDDTRGLCVVTQARAASLRHVASHSFGFGGENCVLVFSR